MRKLTRICTVCGTEILAERFRVPKDKTRCKSCRNRAIALARGPETYKHMRGKNNPVWKDGIMVSKGYVYLLRPDHQMAYKNGYIKRANLIWEEATGHYPEKGEIVHHKNGDHGNDEIENLELMTLSEHMKMHTEKRKIAGSYKGAQAHRKRDKRGRFLPSK